MGEIAPVVSNSVLNLILCDNLTVQTTPEFKEACATHANAVVFTYRSNCTDMLQVIDAGVGRDIKQGILKSSNDWLEDEDNLERWECEISAKERRVLMTRWLGDAWTSFVEKRKDRILRCWEKTGSLMTIDRSDDDKIKPQGLSGVYEFMPLDAPGDDSIDVAIDEPQADGSSDSSSAGHEDRDVEQEIEDGLDGDSDRDELLDDGDGEPETDDEEAALKDVVPDGYVLVDVAPDVLDKSLLGSRVVFRWNAVGWCLARVRKHFGPRSHKEAASFNFVLAYDASGPGEHIEHLLRKEYYDHREDARVGSWVLLRKLQPRPSQPAQSPSSSSSMMDTS